MYNISITLLLIIRIILIVEMFFKNQKSNVTFQITTFVITLICMLFCLVSCSGKKKKEYKKIKLPESYPFDKNGNYRIDWVKKYEGLISQNDKDEKVIQDNDSIEEFENFKKKKRSKKIAKKKSRKKSKYKKVEKLSFLPSENNSNYYNDYFFSDSNKEDNIANKNINLNTNKKVIKPKPKLKYIPKPKSVAIQKKSSPKKVTKIHNVKQGETLWSISRKYKIGLNELRKINKKYDNIIKPGDKLFIK